MPNKDSFVDQARYVRAVSEIVTALVRAYEAQMPINLSRIKGEMAKKHRYAMLSIGCELAVILCRMELILTTYGASIPAGLGTFRS